MSKITVIGSLATDFVVSVDKRPVVGETIIGNDFKTTFGGKGANQVVAAARLGSHVVMIGKVGADSFGTEIIANLKENKISVSSVEPVTHLPSGSAHITLADGDNSIVVIPGANNAVDIQQLTKNKERIKTSDLVLLQQEIPSETVEAIVDFCYQHQIPTVLNPAPACSISQNVIDKVTYLTPNEHEFEELFPQLTVSEGLAKYPNKLIITVGSKGVLFNNGQEEILVPSYQVTPVDTTGAGDTFNGAFSVALTNQLSVAESIRFGNLAASLSIQKFGAQGGMPKLEELKEQPGYEKTWNFK
ncbi:ribokinase [Carnobacterium maltaromaticum]|uniref:ribokinase n=1 Tax=Carnobacterium maltaromaticum TaxID=2751 RepID=UPI000C777891|nr:ribokinase [Carnobacterium maltaromaticum]PLS37049.1 ribokinase [Carnobacterium maltaromaticum]PLS37863.1 ribokinase [Carnobacterium maltaromaticum]PLS39804.1 ribokinase [Carnobacterium maltaromaticum]PLS44560.1 ribokinase [Carnobacterium maltaromaticum]PLS46593.1 ribokinase [Carnobacterium maltaromaticum]